MYEPFIDIFNWIVGVVGVVVLLVALRLTSTLSIPSQQRALRLLLVAGGFFVATELLAGANHLWWGEGLPKGAIALLDEASDLTVIVFLGVAAYLLRKSDRIEVALLRLSADIDQMSGLHNHAFFRRAATRRIEQGKAYGLPLACIMFDVDNFKYYNDRYGHQAGDEVLRCVASVLQGCARSDDLTARYGGEEFVMLLAARPEDAVAVAERIRSAIESGCGPEREGSSLREPITVSVGVASLGEQIRTLEDLVEAADQQMYCAKRAGKNRVASGGFGN